MMKLRVILFIAILSLMISCRKSDKPDEVLLKNMVACDLAQNLDSAAITAKMAGVWTLKKQAVPYSGELIATSKNVKLTFNTDYTFNIRENSIAITQGTWSLIHYSGEHYGLQTSEFSQYAGGAIYICDNRLLLAMSIFDGPDNLFEK